MRDGRYPQGPASLTEHARVLDTLVELKRANGMDPEHLARVRDAALRLVGRGHGADGFTAVIKELAS